MSDQPFIAVVDDESAVLTMLRRALTVASYEVATFGSAEALLDSLSARVPACVVLDIHLPGISGLEVEEHLRSAGLSIPLVLITASDDPSMDASAAAIGAHGLLRKPFSTALLYTTIESALRHP